MTWHVQNHSIQSILVPRLKKLNGGPVIFFRLLILTWEIVLFSPFFVVSSMEQVGISTNLGTTLVGLTFYSSQFGSEWGRWITRVALISRGNVFWILETASGTVIHHIRYHGSWLSTWKGDFKTGFISDRMPGFSAMKVPLMYTKLNWNTLGTVCFKKMWGYLTCHDRFQILMKPVTNEFSKLSALQIFLIS